MAAGEATLEDLGSHKRPDLSVLPIISPEQGSDARKRDYGLAQRKKSPEASPFLLLR